MIIDRARPPMCRAGGVSIALEAKGLRRMVFHVDSNGITLGAIDWRTRRAAIAEPIAIRM